MRKAIDGAGEVADDASPALRASATGCAGSERAAGDPRSFLRGRDTAKYLQEQVVTDRQGRYVVVVKSEHRTPSPA